MWICTNAHMKGVDTKEGNSAALNVESDLPLEILLELLDGAFGEEPWVAHVASGYWSSDLVCHDVLFLVGTLAVGISVVEG